MYFRLFLQTCLGAKGFNTLNVISDFTYMSIMTMEIKVPYSGPVKQTTNFPLKLYNKNKPIKTKTTNF